MATNHSFRLFEEKSEFQNARFHRFEIEELLTKTIIGVGEWNGRKDWIRKSNAVTPACIQHVTRGLISTINNPGDPRTDSREVAEAAHSSRRLLQKTV